MSNEATTYCNARLRQNGFNPGNREQVKPGEWAGEGYCKRPVSEGRCRMHGGNGGRPVEHGLRSALRDDLREYVEKAANREHPGDLKEELAVLRGLLYDFLHRTETLDKDAIEAAHKLLSEIRRTSDTIHKQMTRERLTKEEGQKLFDTFATILRKYVPDSDRDDALDRLENAVGAGRTNRALQSGS